MPSLFRILKPTTRTALVLLAVAGMTSAGAQTPVTPPTNASPQRIALCSRAIVLSGFEAEMDVTIRQMAEDSFTTLRAAFPDDKQTATAYRDSLTEALTAAKAPVLEHVRQSCAAAFTSDELEGINAFFESSPGRAWLEKGRTLMWPALEDAVRDTMPKVVADAQSRFCERMGGCRNKPVTPAPKTNTL
ncbi:MULTISPECIES: DUF2059 domain-containing protein [Sphingobium]|uniref:DUF2059 domain-containing protein n=3 Tax=Sphingobium TaxID=165695 RepID=T0HX80_9SPHN|nr:MULTISPECIES: DUF2059 domain-containing protein [Sphingobium]EQB16723.1 hypothetical protein RLDS_06295 [Sphingobium lactosutens DS20]QDC36573.1 DUF2059 domain-containing protein [Sphingobium fuliginis ATCC 27551]QNG43942.1 DUF2059 domain-containing protein [Sphingobium yanoikuyae]